MKFRILKEEQVFNDYLKINKAQIEHDSFIEGETVHLTRLAVKLGDAIAILIYETDTQCFLLTKQFRYPPSMNNDAWMLEVVAGMVDAGEDPVNAAKREAMEELGYKIDKVTHIGTFYSSPGNSTERVFTYYAEVTSADKVHMGGGLETESEDIQLIKIPVSELKAYVSGKIHDFKTMVTFQWYLLNKQ